MQRRRGDIYSSRSSWHFAEVTTVIIRAEGQYRYIWGPEPSYPKDQPRSGPVEGGLTGKLPVGFETYR